MTGMSDFSDLVQDPRHRRRFEKLLMLAAQRGDADLVKDRLGWGIDPNCRDTKGRTPLTLNVRSSCPSVATVRALLEHGGDPSAVDKTGLTALDYARRKLARRQLRAPRRRPLSPSLDENRQLQLSPDEQARLDRLRRQFSDREFVHIWWKERLRAARRVFNDPDPVERIVALLETAGAAK